MNHILFKGTNEQNKYKITNYQKGEVIFNEGDECFSIYLLLSGEVTISKLTENGKQYVINYLKKDDIFGDSLIFSDNNKFLGDGEAKTNVSLIKLNKNDFLNILKNDLCLLNYLEYTSKRNMQIRKELKILSISNYKERILFYLEQKNTATIKIKSKELLAKELNMPRPSLSRELINLKKENIIDYDKHQITLMKKGTI